jgi:hypothetical protein
MIKAKVTIKGISPILFHRYPDEDFTGKELKIKGVKPTKDEQVEKSLYRTKSGKIYTPADHIIGAMVKAGTNFALKGRKTFKEVCEAGVFIEPVEIVHKNQKYEADWRSAVNHNMRNARVMVGRGRLNQWELEFELVCIDPRATIHDLEDILSYAGNYIGIGSYRPRYGRFEVISFKETKGGEKK